jgi:hypothetical protein
MYKLLISKLEITSVFIGMLSVFMTERCLGE